MNRIEQRYELRLAHIDEVPAIMELIGEWMPGQILSVNRQVYETEFVDGDDVWCVVAVERSTGRIDGLMGFKPCSRSNPERLDLFGCGWYVRPPPVGEPMLGLAIAKSLLPLTGARYHLGTKADPHTTVPLRRLLFGDHTGLMDQYYFLNPSMTLSDFRLLKMPEMPVMSKLPHPQDESTQTSLLCEFNSPEELAAAFDPAAFDAVPFKDLWYLKRRYFDYPWYRYRLFGLARRGCRHVEAVIVTRLCTHDGACMLRIIDYLGERALLGGMHGILTAWCRETGCECVDFFEHGFDGSLLKRSGMLRRGEHAEIVPSFFDPFVQQNIDVWVHYPVAGAVICKGDGDHDRPNRFPPQYT